MSELARMFIGVILLASPLILNLNYFMGKLNCILGGKCSPMNDAQKGMMRSSRSYVCALIATCLFAEYLIDFAVLPLGLDYIIRYAFPISTFLIAMGYHYLAQHKGTAKPSRLCGLCCLGGLGLWFSFIVLGIGLIR